ncbi:MAG: hypothetical protein JJT78_09725 [Leptospira sp.]|nr:hypothetical protein [Leptospira sp.]
MNQSLTSLNLLFRVNIKSILSALVVMTFAIAPGVLYSQTIHYYDGDRKVTLTQENDLLAEKTDVLAGSSSNNPGASLVKKADSNAGVVQNMGGMRIWKTNPTSVKNSLSKNTVGKKFSEDKLIPVFRSESGTMMVPTGNIIVYFQMGMTEEQIEKWSAQRGLRTIQKLPLSTKNAWEIQTPPGIRSIEIANDARSDSSVVTASPNFWIEFSKK